MRASNFKLQKLTKQMLLILSETLIKEIDDPHLHNVTLTAAKLSNDKSDLKIYVDYHDRDQLEQIVQLLNQNVGIFRFQLSQQLSIYKIPKIRFFVDDILINAQKIENLINDSLKKIQD